MSDKKKKVVRFAAKGENSFYDAVKSSVDDYFTDNNISSYANGAMWLKTVVMLLLYFVPYIIIISGTLKGNAWLFYSCWAMMALGMIGIGTSVMHDANHGTYSPDKKMNAFVGNILNAIGGYTVTWRIQHNILHHTYTNITGLDEDIDSIKLLRFSPRQPHRWYHRYQYLYAWFFYMIMTLFWMTAKDYLQIFRYQKHGLLTQQRVTFGQAILHSTLYKIIYYTYIIAIPVLVSGMAWYAVVGGFLLMHFITGLFLSCVFQPAHVVDSSPFEAPVEMGGKQQMKDTWAVHEVVNTSNFAPRNKILSWYIGGLNYQIEHHLFTKVCHVHYASISPIVASVAAAYGIPYHVQPSFRVAVLNHARMLKRLGRKEY